MKMRATVSAIMVSALLIFAGCNQSASSSDNDKEETMTPVKTNEIETGNFKIKKSVFGRTAPEKQTPIMIEQPGELKTLKVTNGDKVKKDDHVATVDDTEIEAPMAGTVARLEATEGANVSNEDPLMLIIELDKVTANFSVTSSMRKLLEKDDEVDVYVEEKKYEGKVLSVDSLANDSGQYPAKVNIDNKDDDILPGMTAKLITKELKEKDTVIIPTEAVITTQADGDYVFIIDGYHAKRVNVSVQSTQTDQTAVDADLDEDDEIIIEGQDTLVDGSLIEVKESSSE